MIFLAAEQPVRRIGEWRHFLEESLFSAFHHDKLAKATPYLLLKAVFQFPGTMKAINLIHFAARPVKRRKGVITSNWREPIRFSLSRYLFVLVGLEQDRGDFLEGYGFPFIKVYQETTPC